MNNDYDELCNLEDPLYSYENSLNNNINTKNLKNNNFATNNNLTNYETYISNSNKNSSDNLKIYDNNNYNLPNMTNKGLVSNDLKHKINMTNKTYKDNDIAKNTLSNRSHNKDRSISVDISVDSNCSNKINSETINNLKFKSNNKTNKLNSFQTFENKSSSINSNKQLFSSSEVINNLKNRICNYESELNNLIHEKITMQIELNALKAKLLQVNKKKFNQNSPNINTITNNTNINSVKNSVESLKSNKSVKSLYSDNNPNDLSKQFIYESSGIKNEINNLENIINNQKKCLEDNNSLLDESLICIDAENKNKNNKLNIEENEQAILSPHLVNNTNSKSLNTSQNKGYEIQKMDEIINEINKIKSDLYSLVELVQLNDTDNNVFKINESKLKKNKDNSKLYVYNI